MAKDGDAVVSELEDATKRFKKIMTTEDDFVYVPDVGDAPSLKKRLNDIVAALALNLIYDGGFFTPSSTKEYPDKPGVSTFWVIKVPDGGYEFTTGTAAGQKALFGDWMIYLRSADEYQLLPASPLRRGVAQATEDEAGLMKIATDAESEDPDNNLAAITPKKLDHVLDNRTATATENGGLKARLDETTATLYLSFDGSDV